MSSSYSTLGDVQYDDSVWGDVQFHFKTPYYYTAHDATLTCMGRGGVGVAEDAWDREDWSQDAQKLELVEIFTSPLAAGSTVEKNCRAGF